MRGNASTRDTLGSNVRWLRQTRNLTQENLGRLAAMSRNQVGRVERGEINVEMQVLDRLAGALGVKAWELLQPRDRAGR